MRLRCFGRQISFSRPTRHEFARAVRSRRAWAACVAAAAVAAVPIVGLALRDPGGAACAFHRARAAVAARAPNTWLQAKIGTAGVCRLAAEEADGPADAGTLQLRTVPAGATIDVDGRPRGHTPLELRVQPGAYDIRVRLTGFLGAAYRVELGPGENVALATDLWRLAPSVARVRPASPGLSVAGAAFLADGSLALTFAPNGGAKRQAWVLSPAGHARRLGPQSSPGPIAVSPNGARVAYLAPDQQSAAGGGFLATPGARPARELWITDAGGERAERLLTLPAVGSVVESEYLEDVRWSPDGAHLLLIARRSAPSGPPQTRLLWVDAASSGAARGAAVEVASLPSEVVIGSETWDPSGGRVAFLTRTSRLTSLCVASVTGPAGADGGFRYVADLAPASAAASPLPWAAPLAWSADGAHIVYAAPAVARPVTSVFVGALTGLLGTSAAGARGTLFDADLTQLSGQSPDRLLLAAPDGAPLWPVWRSDGTMVAITRAAANGSYRFALAAADAQPTAVPPDTPLPFRPTPLRVPALPAKGAAFAVLWDAAHAQALLAVSRPATGLGAAQGGAPPDLWLLRFGAAESTAQGVAR